MVCGATNEHGANRWARIKAYATGWYTSRARYIDQGDDEDEILIPEMNFCPDHCPPFAANYRPPGERRA